MASNEKSGLTGPMVVDSCVPTRLTVGLSPESRFRKGLGRSGASLLIGMNVFDDPVNFRKYICQS